jgi:ubiquinone/menaquinone biosynthesis C-methylase UbiE
MSSSGITEEKPPMQAADWSGAMGEKWNRWHDQFEYMLAPIGEATLALARCRQGERILDIGCGAGISSCALARQVGANGQVLGLDISPALIATCVARARQQNIANASFLCGDAAVLKLPEADYDCLFSRFGVMFFAEPFAAFRNLRSMLRQGGRVAFCCWGPRPENPWVSSLTDIVAAHIPLPPPDAYAPGPFAFADQGHTRAILEQAGFAHINFTPWRGSVSLGGAGSNADTAVEFVEKALFVSEVLQGKPEPLRQAVLADIRKFLHSQETAEGVALAAMAWLVSADC